MSSEMRLSFYDADLKVKLQNLAADSGISLNEIVNKILAAHFSEVDRKGLQLLCDLIEVKREEGIS